MVNEAQRDDRDYLTQRNNNSTWRRWTRPQTYRTRQRGTNGRSSSAMTQPPTHHWRTPRLTACSMDCRHRPRVSWRPGVVHPTIVSAHHDLHSPTAPLQPLHQLLPRPKRLKTSTTTITLNQGPYLRQGRCHRCRASPHPPPWRPPLARCWGCGLKTAKSFPTKPYPVQGPSSEL
jgi:hypothetical protein